MKALNFSSRFYNPKRVWQKWTKTWFFYQNDGIQMAIIAQKVYQKCKLWLLFAACCWSITDCTENHSTISKETRATWLATKNEIESYGKIDSSKAFLVLKRFQKKYPNSVEVQAICELGYAETYKYWYKSDKVIKHATKAIELSKKAGNLDLQIQAHLLISETSPVCESCTDELLFIESLVKKEAKNITPLNIFRFYYDFGFYYYEMSDYKTAKQYFNKALELTIKEKFLYEQSLVLLAISYALNREGFYIESINYSKKAIYTCEHFNPIECGNHYYQYAISLLELKRYNEALEAILKADRLYKKHPHPFNAGEVAGILGSIYLKQKKYTESEKSYLIFLKKARFPSTKIWAYNMLTNFYYEKGDFKNAYLNSKKFIRMRDSIYSNERTYNAIEKRTNFELAGKDEEVREANKRFQLALLIGVLFIVLGSAFSFLIYRNNKLTRQLIELEQEKLQQQIDFEQRKLATTTLHLSQQSDLLRTLKKEIEQLVDGADTGLRTKIKSILRLIDNNVNDEDEWNKFKLHFEAVSPHFFEALRQRSSILTELDLKHCAYLKINLSPKQVAQILGISPKSVTLSRVRIKKKLQLNEEESLNTFLQSL